MPEAYHTALRPPEVAPERVYRWERRGSKAFVHNVHLGLPLDFYGVDVIYSEIPWADGYDEFARRAEQPNGSVPDYANWLYRLSGSLMVTNRPWVIVAGRQALRHMACQWWYPVQLNGSTAVAIGAGLPEPGENVREAEQLIRRLAARFKSIGDPCCGYGRAGRIFTEHGKPFVMTDINPRCIGYIAANAEGWNAR